MDQVQWPKELRNLLKTLGSKGRGPGVEHKKVRALELSEKKFEGFENVFVANSGGLDAVGERVVAKGMDLDRFNKNGVVLYQHAGYYSANPDVVIAKGSVWEEGDRLMLGITEWDIDSDLGSEVKRKVDKGFLNAVSIGFIERAGEYDKDKNYIITEAELLEVSVVNIPADKDAIRVKSIDTPGEEDSAPTSEIEVQKKRVEVYLKMKRNREKFG